MIIVLFYSLSWILPIFSFSGCYITISWTNFKSMQRENTTDSASYTNYMHLNWIHNCIWVFGSHQQNCLIIPCTSWPFLSIQYFEFTDTYWIYVTKRWEWWNLNFLFVIKIWTSIMKTFYWWKLLSAIQTSKSQYRNSTGSYPAGTSMFCCQYSNKNTL